MPRLNSRGGYVCGVGGGVGNLHIMIGDDNRGNTTQIGATVREAICAAIGVPPQGEGAGWNWKDDRTIAGQLCGIPYPPNLCGTFTYNLDSGAVAGPYGPGANDGRGRGGVHAWYLGGAGIYSTDGYNSGAGPALGDVLGDGSIVIFRDQQQATLGLNVINRAGQVIQTIPTQGQVAGVYARGQIVLWFDHSLRQMRAWSTSAAAPMEPPIPTAQYNFSGPFAIDASGRGWILDASQGLLLRAWDTPIGYWISRDGNDFFSDIVALPNGLLRVAASYNQGETPGTTRIYDIDPIAGTMTRQGNGESITLIDVNTGAPIHPGTVTAPVSIMRPDGVVVPASASLATRINAVLSEEAIAAIGVVIVAGAILLSDE